jgi:hypothetical protein
LPNTFLTNKSPQGGDPPPAAVQPAAAAPPNFGPPVAQIFTNTTGSVASIPPQGLPFDVQSLADTMAEASQKIAELNAKVAQLQQEKSVTNAAPKRKKARTDLDKTILTVLRETIKRHVWAKIKFVTSDIQKTHFALAVLKASEINDLFTKDEPPKPTQQGYEYANKYGDDLVKELNDIRSYAGGRMKDSIFDWMDVNGVTEIPALEEYQKLLTRDPTVNEDLFVWYWKDYLPRCCAGAKIWNDQTKYYGLISTHAPPKTPDQPYITPSTEAWGILWIENTYTRLPKLRQESKANKGKKNVYVNEDKEDTGEVHYINKKADPDFVGKWTQMDSGQSLYGGWAKEGIDRYKELIALNVEARAKPTTKALETKIYKKVRHLMKITADAPSAGGSGSKKKKSSTVEEVDGLIDLTDWGFAL